MHFLSAIHVAVHMKLPARRKDTTPGTFRRPDLLRSITIAQRMITTLFVGSSREKLSLVYHIRRHWASLRRIFDVAKKRRCFLLPSALVALVGFPSCIAQRGEWIVCLFMSQSPCESDA